MHATPLCYTSTNDFVTDMPAAAVPDAADTVPDITDIAIPDVEDTTPEPVPEATTTSAEITTDDGTTAGRSLLDAFYSDNFLDALRRDRSFGPLESDDLNMGEADWLVGTLKRMKS
ncbi:hypothetical protein AM587_10006184 [Phytophthora nicotianae]|uniref:Uncharacterized protein n=1 Tax=Phytophthora nicotianae TaxID=4792 RepID=A0A0W8D861_PHYNI|nr:hypothetical protein AM587_10006184 [Phytophthora nicotianae]